MRSQREEVQAGLHRVADRAEGERPQHRAAVARQARAGRPPRPTGPGWRSRSGRTAAWRRRRPPRRRACRRSASRRRPRRRPGREGLQCAAAWTAFEQSQPSVSTGSSEEYRAVLLHDAGPQADCGCCASSPTAGRSARWRRRWTTARPPCPSSWRCWRRRPACRCSSARAATCASRRRRRRSSATRTRCSRGWRRPRRTCRPRRSR